MKASDLLVAALENEGVEAIFALPGEENLDVMESLRNSNIVVHLVRHEQSAAFMAAAYGRLSGKPGVCLTTLGPGATNTMTGVAYAHLGGMPMLLITGQKPIKDRVQGSFQVLDVVDMMGPITKDATQIIDANHIPTAVRQAFREAVIAKPGPIHIELPEDIAADQTDTNIRPVTQPSPPAARSEVVEEVAQRIKQARKPLILVSSGAARTGARDALTALIDTHNFYFCSTQMGKGVVDERNPLCLGTVAVSSGDYIHDIIGEADLIINIGHDLTEKPPYVMTAESCDVIHVDSTPARVDQVYFAQYEMVGCIATNLNNLQQALSQEQPRENYFSQEKALIEREIFALSAPTTNPMSPQYLVASLNQGLDDSAMLSLDNGLYKIWFARHFIASHRTNLLLDNALATMGAGLPVAIAAKLHGPERNVIAVCGDGGFLMNCQELETAVRLELDLIVLVLTDDAYGMIKWKQRNDDFPEFGMDFNAVDLARYAEAFGATGHHLDEPEQLNEMLAKARKAGGVHVIDVPIDYSAVKDERIL